MSIETPPHPPHGKEYHLKCSKEESEVEYETLVQVKTSQVDQFTNPESRTGTDIFDVDRAW